MTFRKLSFSLLLALACVIPWCASPVHGGNILYTLNVSGTGNFLEVNQENGRATPIAPTVSLGPGSWNGLTASPVDPTILYAVNNPRPATFDEPQYSRLSRIDIDTGTATLFSFFDFEQLGAEDVFSSGIAISPLDPDVAVVVGSDKGIPPKALMWRVDTATGEVLETGQLLDGISRMESITFAQDGETIIGANQDGEIVEIDPATAEVSVLGSPGLSGLFTGLAFHPDGTLFAIDALRSDRLITLEPSDGSLDSLVGPMFIPGPEGLAFAFRDEPLDCNEDGLVDAQDLECANANDITTELLAQLNLLPGDLDAMDGVGFADFVQLARNFGLSLGKYTDGDFDDSGDVGLSDYLILAANFGRLSPDAAAVGEPVPEPSGHILLIFGMLAFIRCRRAN